MQAINYMNLQARLELRADYLYSWKVKVASFVNYCKVSNSKI